MKNKEWKQTFLDKLRKSSVEIIQISNVMLKTPAGCAIASQLIRPSTSPVANFQKAQDASSPKNFVQKLSLAISLSNETKYSLQLIIRSNLLYSSEINILLTNVEETIAILTSNIKSAKLTVVI